jgi:glycyl-tRNA synthetase
MTDQTLPAMSSIVSLAKRTGYVYPSSDIYGGLNGFFDYGPMGTALKENIRRFWWNSMVERPPLGPDGKPLQIFGIDSSIILNPDVWKASGHVDGFHDELSDCTETKKRYRADHILCYEARLKGETEALGYVSVMSGDDADEQLEKRFRFVEKSQSGKKLERPQLGEAIPFVALSVEDYAKVLAPEATTFGTLTEPRTFGLMFETSVGALAGSDSKAYLRPETAQGIFINFKNVVASSRAKMPFGIAQIGKAFRNEITPRNFIFRSREFEQMELEWFCPPEESEQWYEFWSKTRHQWWLDLGIRPENLILRPHDSDELAHYSSACVDVEYRFPFARGEFGELEGVANRADYDLTQHATHAKVKMEFHDQANNRAFVPHVIEPSAGLTRALLAVLCDAYRYDESRPSKEYLALPPKLAPVTAGVFPLIAKDGLPEYAQKLNDHLSQFFTTRIDEKQSIGKRYARMDEIGTPFCITVDQDTLSDNAVTIRDRDTGDQQRVATDKVDLFLQEKVNPGETALGSFKV